VTVYATSLGGMPALFAGMLGRRTRTPLNPLILPSPQILSRTQGATATDDGNGTRNGAG
jgi:hypothetical protein